MRAKKSFNENVYDLISQIPSGNVSTYCLIAKMLRTKAFRAVGNACHNNPYAPVVPCHRVVKSDGTLGGFSSGSAKKIKLLKKEGIEVRDKRIVNFEKVLHKF
ncbi:MAG: MGMT family protein [Candidatus Aenigmarchaeota archaeon]|nr:MGMT family protein [Candidatus Aenigmarchaeota archaeon]HLC59465.1 MGMT family protein [archaeon]